MPLSIQELPYVWFRPDDRAQAGRGSAEHNKQRSFSFSSKKEKYSLKQCRPIPEFVPGRNNKPT
jgi:hypothetical protein